MTFFLPKLTPVQLHGKALVVPIVSTANVSQLAVDILIASLSLRCVGLFDPRDLVPVVGGRDDGEEGVVTPLELYGSDASDVVVIQQRSPVLKARKEEFIASLLQFIQEYQFSSVLFLSGVDSSNRTDSQMQVPTYLIRPPNSPPYDNTRLSSLADLPIPEYTSPVIQQHAQINSASEGPVPFVPGGGLTRRILSSIPPSWSVPTASLLQFVLEGDNRQDAALMAAVVAKVLSVGINEWKQPSSWKQGLFGTPHDQTLYG